MLVSLQGKFYIALVSGGVPGAFRYVGNVPTGNSNISMSLDRYTHNESESGQRLEDARIITGKSAALTMTLEDWSKENLALALFGTGSVISASSVATPGETFPNPVAAGDFIRLAYGNISNTVLKDSAGSSATLTLDTHYSIESAEHGLIKMLDVTGFTQPFKMDSYDYGAQTNVNMFTQLESEYWLRFDAVDSAPGNDPQLVELYRVVLDPISDLQLLHDEVGRLPLTGQVLYDSSKVADNTLGQFGRIVLL